MCLLKASACTDRSFLVSTIRQCWQRVSGAPDARQDRILAPQTFERTSMSTARRCFQHTQKAAKPDAWFLLFFACMCPLFSLPFATHAPAPHFHPFDPHSQLPHPLGEKPPGGRHRRHLAGNAVPPQRRRCARGLVPRRRDSGAAPPPTRSPPPRTPSRPSPPYRLRPSKLLDAEASGVAASPSKGEKKKRRRRKRRGLGVGVERAF